MIRGAMFVFLLLACSKQPTPNATPDAAPQQASQAAPSSTTSAKEWMGKWVNASCGERGFARYLTFNTDGSLELEDHVSPCPPGAPCAWSGIIVAPGSWVGEGDDVVLALKPTAGPPLQFAPSRLSWKGAPAEGNCMYERVGDGDTAK